MNFCEMLTGQGSKHPEAKTANCQLFDRTELIVQSRVDESQESPFSESFKAFSEPLRASQGVVMGPRAGLKLYTLLPFNSLNYFTIYLTILSPTRASVLPSQPFDLPFLLCYLNFNRVIFTRSRLRVWRDMGIRYGWRGMSRSCIFHSRPCLFVSTFPGIFLECQAAVNISNAFGALSNEKQSELLFRAFATLTEHI